MGQWNSFRVQRRVADGWEHVETDLDFKGRLWSDRVGKLTDGYTDEHCSDGTDCYDPARCCKTIHEAFWSGFNGAFHSAGELEALALERPEFAHNIRPIVNALAAAGPGARVLWFSDS